MALPVGPDARAFLRGRGRSINGPVGKLSRTMTIAAIWLAKLLGVGLRLVGRRGNALPGLVVERLYPGFLPRALAQLEAGCRRCQRHQRQDHDNQDGGDRALPALHRVLTNDTGSNFVRGTITAVCEHASWRGRLRADVAVFELDEAHAVRFIAVVRPDRVLLLNVMRDQLDRFGEIDTTARVASAGSCHRADCRCAESGRSTHRSHRRGRSRRYLLLRCRRELA